MHILKQYYGTYFCRIAGKIAKIRTHQNFVPHGIIQFSFSLLESFSKKKLTMSST